MNETNLGGSMKKSRTAQKALKPVWMGRLDISVPPVNFSQSIEAVTNGLSPQGSSQNDDSLLH